MIKSKNIMKKNKQKRKVWTPEEDEIIRNEYSNTKSSVIALKIGRSVSEVYNRAYFLGVKKSEAFLLKQNQELGKALKKYGKETQFKKGNVPANKGKKQTEYMTAKAIERTKATRFKKGQQPHNHQPIGHQRITKDGYVMVKVEEPNRFVLLHRWIWKIWNGEIEKGKVIGFKDGNKQNCNIENLECITMKENMLRNTIQRYPDELRDVMLYTGRLKKKIARKLSNN